MLLRRHCQILCTDDTRKKPVNGQIIWVGTIHDLMIGNLFMSFTMG